jgi:haloacetate dehalogenase
VCPDLRGYGDSSKPHGEADHATYSKRSSALDQVELMRALGFDRFAVVAHDRGARVAHRMALDHAAQVSALVVLDTVPTTAVWDSIDRDNALGHFHWLFLSQPEPLPERLIGAQREFFLRWILKRWAGGDGLEEAAIAEYLRCFDEAAIHAACEDYRAGASIDILHDAEDLDTRIECRVHLLWSAHGTGAAFDVAAVWRGRASQVSGRALDCGHFIAEERPEETAEAIRSFLD